jgi:phage tail sheath protein FI
MSMPVQPTYPGVYIEEIPSGVRTITGVATSIAAFVGRARRGPVNEPVTLNSFGDFERIFGGLWADSTLGYAVRGFYLNGGGQAVIVRLFGPSDQELQAARQAAEAVAAAAQTEADRSSGTPPTLVSVVAAANTAAAAQPSGLPRTAANLVAQAAVDAADDTGATVTTVKNAARSAAALAVPQTKSRLSVSGLTLEAVYPGAWGEGLRAAVDQNVSAEIAQRMGLTAGDLFNLTVQENGGATEVFRNVSVKDSSRRLDKVLEDGSRLVRWAGSWPAPADLPVISAAAEDDLTTAQKALKTAQDALANPPSGADPQALQAAKDAATADRDQAQAALSASDGRSLTSADFFPAQAESNKIGLFALEKTDLFNLLCLPPLEPEGDIDPSVIPQAAAYCERRRAMLLVDPPSSWNDKDDAKSGVASIGTNSKNAALFFPRLRQPNPLHDNQMEDFVPSGAVAGVFARTDAQRGVWKAPAGLDATLVGVPALTVPLTDAENGELNPLGVNCLRIRPAAGPVVWGARTLQGDDRLASEWKYIPVRRLALYLEESLYRGTQWVVFEPNDEPLWSQIRLNVGAFMNTLFRQGAFQGKTPREAYLVKCDRETTTQTDINSGIVNIVVGFAPLKPAEFVIIKIQQLAGQIQT